MPPLTHAQFGDLSNVQIPTDEKSGTHRGFGFVEFEEREDALAALDNMHGAELLGCARAASASAPRAMRAR